MTPKKLIYLWVETFNRIDIDGLVNMYHEDAINHQVNTEPLYGREAIRQMFTEEFSKANMICEIENVFEDGNTRMERPLWIERLRFLPVS